MVILFTALAFAALAAWLVSRRQIREAGLPPRAPLVYSDTGGWERVEKPLFSKRYVLTGKPDYVVAEGTLRIPIEVKPNRPDLEPRLGDVLQLAAYGLLIEEHFGASSPYGLLKYRRGLFRVDFTEELRAQLVRTLEEMRAGLDAAEVARSHDDPRRCRGCGYRRECGQALEENSEG